MTTSHRITACARRLTDDRGFDGFTMEELAEAAGVSRRTLFNYFPGKLDAVLGPGPEIGHEVLTTFRAGGPSGVLLDDIKTLIGELLETKEFDRDEAEITRRIFRSNPRLLSAVHDRFHAIDDMFTDALLTREGKAFGKRRARVLVTVLACLFDVAMDEVISHPAGERELTDTYFDALDALSELLTH